ncbi:hypothetical protein KQI86_03840 [Clostridium sp. MSJ-11]|uniref:DUF1565 domain-containing protein n=1 Tax=Clostridium mobile TaxID=2841512 RepID=A0ABS6EE66_9CLOT|nr:hypothetical protein [Clostridium mobile]MBU5483447.1 hypothetical protein [Clostridium mobile]
MAKINLNGTEVEYNNIYYISTNGNDNTGDGRKSNPFASFPKAMSLAQNNDLIYFLKGMYNISEMYNVKGSAGTFLYDDNKPIVIYAEKYSYFKIDNPINKVRDTSAIVISNASTKVIGFTIDYNVTKTTVNYERAIFGRNAGYARGAIYNSHFIIRSKTSFSYANSGNALTCYNCNFDILDGLENAYSGETTFNKCTFSNISRLNSNAGMKGTDNKYNVSYDADFNSVPDDEGYGVMYGDFSWRYKPSLFLVKQEANYILINNNYYNLGRPKDDNQLLEWYKKYGYDKPDIISDKLTIKDFPLIVPYGATSNRTMFELDANDIKNSIEFIEDEEKGDYIRHGSNEYRIYDKLADRFDKFEITMIE